MRRSAIAFIVLAVCSGTTTVAEEANDIVFRLAAIRKPAVYRIGEQIDLDGVFSEKSPGHCLVVDGFDGVRNPWWKQSEDEFHVVRIGGADSDRGAVYDPYFDEHDFNPSMIDSISLLSSDPSLGGGPLTIHFVLNEWVRIATPGRYRVTARSARISHCPSGDGTPPQPTPWSNEIEITVLPADDSWAASALQEIRRVLDDSSADRAKAFAVRRLSYLNTRDSTIEMAARFITDETGSTRQLLANGLYESSWRDTAISELDRRFRAENQVPESIYRVLTMLRVAREFQDQPLPDAPDEHWRAIEARGIRFQSILEELYSARPDSRRPLY